ncbi:MAG: hypothetical protein AAFO82_09800 [Bacteroidota bacterium]
MKKSLFTLLIGVLAIAAISMTTSIKENPMSTAEAEELEILKNVDLQEFSSELEFDEVISAEYKLTEDGSYEVELSVLKGGEVQEMKVSANFGNCYCYCGAPHPRDNKRRIAYSGKDLCLCAECRPPVDKN